MKYLGLKSKFFSACFQVSGDENSTGEASKFVAPLLRRLALRKNVNLKQLVYESKTTVSDSEDDDDDEFLVPKGHGNKVWSLFPFHYDFILCYDPLVVILL